MSPDEPRTEVIDDALLARARYLYSRVDDDPTSTELSRSLADLATLAGAHRDVQALVVSKAAETYLQVQRYPNQDQDCPIWARS